MEPIQLSAAVHTLCMYINVVDVIVGNILCIFHSSTFKCPINGSDNLSIYIKLALMPFNGTDTVISSNTHFGISYHPI